MSLYAIHYYSESCYYIGWREGIYSSYLYPPYPRTCGVVPVSTSDLWSTMLLAFSMMDG